MQNNKREKKLSFKKGKGLLAELEVSHTPIVNEKITPERIIKGITFWGETEDMRIILDMLVGNFFMNNKNLSKNLRFDVFLTWEVLSEALTNIEKISWK